MRNYTILLTLSLAILVGCGPTDLQVSTKGGVIPGIGGGSTADSTKTTLTVVDTAPDTPTTGEAYVYLIDSGGDTPELKVKYDDGSDASVAGESGGAAYVGPTIGLKAHWPLHNDGADIVGSYNFTVTYGTPIYSGTQVQLNSSSWISTSTYNHPLYVYKDDFVLSFWVKNYSSHPILSVGQYDRHNNPGYFIYGGVTPDFVGTTGGGLHTSTLAYGEWGHYVVFRSNTATVLYLNGVLVAETTGTYSSGSGYQFEELYLSTGYNGIGSAFYANMRCFQYSALPDSVTSGDGRDLWVWSLHSEGAPE